MPVTDILTFNVVPEFLEELDLNKNKQWDFEELQHLNTLPLQQQKELGAKAMLALNRQFRAGNSNLRKIFPDIGISNDEYVILEFLQTGPKTTKQGSGSYSQKEISDATGISTTTVAVVVDNMDVARKANASKNRGWITRMENPDNRREKLVSLTKEGAARLRMARKVYFQGLALPEGWTFLEAVLFLSLATKFNKLVDPKHDPNPETLDEDEDAN